MPADRDLNYLLTVRLSAAHARWLQDRADLAGVSRAEIVRRCIERFAVEQGRRWWQWWK